MGTSRDLGRLVKVYWSLLLGNVVEWYEYAVYGYLAPVLEVHFFRGSEVAVWVGFGVTFLARPLGGLTMGVIGDRWGRGAAINMSIIGMLIGTCGQGLLPTYHSGSEAAGLTGLILLVVLRFIQGLSAAGEISTISTFLTEVGPKHAIGRGIALVSITANSGFLLAKAVVYAVRVVLGEDRVMTWGWRLPFLLALVPGLVAVWGRRKVPESPMYLENAGSGENNGSPDSGSPNGSRKGMPVVGKSTSDTLKVAVGTYWSSIAVGAGAMASFAIMQYGCFVWGQSFLAHKGMPADDRMLVGLVARMIMIVLALPVGWLADVQGVGWVTLFGSLVASFLSFPLWHAVQSAPTNITTVMWSMGVGMALLNTLVGTVPFFFVVELFPTAIRNTAVGISYNLGFSVFGGLAPVVAQASLPISSDGPGVLYACGGAITALSVIAGLALQRQGALRLTHVRDDPYFKGFMCGAVAAKGKFGVSDSDSDTGAETVSS